MTVRKKLFIISKYRQRIFTFEEEEKKHFFFFKSSHWHSKKKKYIQQERFNIHIVEFRFRVRNRACIHDKEKKKRARQQYMQFYHVGYIIFLFLVCAKKIHDILHIHMTSWSRLYFKLDDNLLKYKFFSLLIYYFLFFADQQQIQRGIGAREFGMDQSYHRREHQYQWRYGQSIRDFEGRYSSLQVFWSFFFNSFSIFMLNTQIVDFFFADW